MVDRILLTAIATEFDVIAGRQRARQIAAACGFAALDQARIGTVVSELARNIFNYAGAGTIVFAIGADDARPQLLITVEDQGGGIADIDLILSGCYRSATGMGLGILSARRLMDQFDIVSGPAGTRITVGKYFPAQAPTVTAHILAPIIASFKTLPTDAALSEARHQNRELTDTLAALQLRQDELMEATARLEETNSRIESLNTLLDDKAAALQQADRSKDEFLAILSHELRGPLSAAGMAAQLLQSKAVSAERTTQMGALIARQVVHMSKLVEDLLDVSRVSRGLVQIDTAPVELHAVIAAAIEQVQAAANLKQHRIAQALGAARLQVLGDHTRLVQVLSNLLTNAIRYTNDGGAIEIRLEAQGGIALLQVTDNGSGIDAALMPRLFDLYVQAERSSDRIGGGLGLGLALVKSLVEAHAGTVSAASAGAGCGSRFSVRLPLYLA